MNLNQLQNGVRAKVRLSRRDNEEGAAPDWRLPQIVTLQVARRVKPFTRRGVTYPAGEIIGLTIEDFSWAEYTEKDYNPATNQWLVEEYRLEILEVLS